MELPTTKGPLLGDPGPYSPLQNGDQGTSGAYPGVSLESGPGEGNFHLILYYALLYCLRSLQVCILLFFNR